MILTVLLVAHFGGLVAIIWRDPAGLASSNSLESA